MYDLPLTSLLGRPCGRLGAGDQPSVWCFSEAHRRKEAVVTGQDPGGDPSALLVYLT